MNILFYTPFNSRSRDTETLMQAFKNQGHNVFLLTQDPWDAYQEQCKKYGVEVFTHVLPKRNSIVYFVKHSLYLIRFCQKNKIDVVYAHLENAGLSAVLAQYFIKAKVFACRHVIDEAYLLKSKKFILLNKIVYGLSKQVIVVSEHCKNWMVEKEKIKSNKIKVIPLAYNFDLYAKPDRKIVREIKIQYPCEMLLLIACRMVKAKRAELSIQLTQQLIAEGFDVKLLVLGSGPELETLQTQVKTLSLEAKVFVLGFKTNIMDYLAACDLLVHPSLMDSSSVIIKEAGLNAKPVIACAGIGDVDEYLVSGQNAFLVSEKNTLEEMALKIKSFYRNTALLKYVGENLQEVVVQRFNILKIIETYNGIHKSIRA